MAIDVQANRDKLVAAMEQAARDGFVFNIHEPCQCIFAVRKQYADIDFGEQHAVYGPALGLPVEVVWDIFAISSSSHKGHPERYGDIAYHTQRLRDAFAAHPVNRMENTNND